MPKLSPNSSEKVKIIYKNNLFTERKFRIDNNARPSDSIRIKLESKTNKSNRLKVFYNSILFVEIELIEIDVTPKFLMNKSIVQLENSALKYMSLPFRQLIYNTYKKRLNLIDLNYKTLINCKLEARDRLNPHICAVATIGNIGYKHMNSLYIIYNIFAFFFY